MKTYDGLKTINRLKRLWFPAILLLLLLLIVQTSGNKFGDQASKVWWWFSQTVLPLTLLLVILSVRAQQSTYSTVSGTVRWLSTLLIVVYYISIVYTLLFASLNKSVNSISFLKNSTIYLLIFEGLVMGFLGLTFFRSKKAKQIAKAELDPDRETGEGFVVPDGIDTSALVSEYEIMVQKDQLRKLQNALVDFSKKHKLPYQDILLSQRNLRQLEKDRLVNIISNENYDLQKSKITNFLLLKINALKK